MGNNYVRNAIILLILTALGIGAYNIWESETTPPSISYSTFLEQLRKGEIKKVHIKGGELRIVDKYDRHFSTFAPDITVLMPELDKYNVEVTAESSKISGIEGVLNSLLPVLLILGAWFIFTRNSGQKASSFGKDKAKDFSRAEHRVTFDDVAGIPEAKEELMEVVDFLKFPEKYRKLGAQIPKGVLLQGPPGTGKTLMAKAIAGEAGVPFFSLSGSDFVEMFVGVGASRVRELFKEAKKMAPCIVFIDEIDAIGSKRSAGGSAGGGHDEREQTLNALLVEMDGFESNKTVIIIAATNRPDVLDPALLRAGRFDRQITIPLPDVKGRLRILEVHAKKIKISRAVRLAEIARSIPGFSGADTANLVNEAALMAARHGKEVVELEDFEEAKDKIIMGLERKSMVISEKEKRITAYHEAGHAIVAKLLPETDALHKITIMPRGRALGLTQQLPLDERHTYSTLYLENRIKTLFGGRAAEEIVFNQRTTGASNDLLSATEIATRMVCEWGMNDTIGPLSIVSTQEGFLGGTSTARSYSEKTAQEIDRQVKELLDRCYQETLDMLKANNEFLHKLAEVLLVHETIDAEEVDIVLKCSVKQKKKKSAAENAACSVEDRGSDASRQGESLPEVDGKDKQDNSGKGVVSQEFRSDRII